MKSSNFHATIESHGRVDLAMAIKIAFAETVKVAHYSAIKGANQEDILVFYWHDAGGHIGIKPLPYSMTPDAVIEMVWHWVPDANRGSEPEMDGSVEASGFRVETNRRLDAELFRVTAVWTLFGK